MAFNRILEAREPCSENGLLIVGRHDDHVVRAHASNQLVSQGRTPTSISTAKQKVSRVSGARRMMIKIVTATAYQTSLRIAIAGAAFVPKGDPSTCGKL